MTEQRQPESDDRFEERLQSFRPIAPKQLRISTQSRVPWRALSYACALIVLIAVAIRFSGVRTTRGTARAIDEELEQTRNISGTVTVGRLNEALRASDRDFDQFVRDSGRDLLPHEHKGTALYALSKE